MSYPVYLPQRSQLSHILRESHIFHLQVTLSHIAACFSHIAARQAAFFLLLQLELNYCFAATINEQEVHTWLLQVVTELCKACSSSYQYVNVLSNKFCDSYALDSKENISDAEKLPVPSCLKGNSGLNSKVCGNVDSKFQVPPKLLLVCSLRTMEFRLQQGLRTSCSQSLYFNKVLRS